jgi:23S rRNA (guanosine2251-2'-O)-methyltransferase
VAWEHAPDVFDVIRRLKEEGFDIYALEQTPDAKSLPELKPPESLALIVGREVEGLEPNVIAACDGSLEIPMAGRKESFNVTQAAAMALFHCIFS